MQAIASAGVACKEGRMLKGASTDDPKGPKRTAPRALGAELKHRALVGPERALLLEMAIGAIVATLAVAIRWSLPLGPQQLPTITVVVSLAVVTTVIGVRAGVVTALMGGLLCWYLFFNANSWSLANDAWIPLVGFAVIATVIVTTSHLYRRSERRSHEQNLAMLEERTANAELFAREMAHRLKNALAIVQSVAFQTFGSDKPEALKFAARLRALADANELLSEQVDEPTAPADQVVRTALQPFDHGSVTFEIACADTTIPARQVVTLALALHELATNAVKYGALSTPSGRVLLRLEDVDEELRLTWKEQNGPEVIAPLTEGFGTRLLRRAGMGTRFDFEPDGLRCSFALRRA